MRVRASTLALGLALSLAALPVAAAERFRVDDVPPGDALTIRERPDAEAPGVARVPANAPVIGFGCTNETPSGRTWCRVKYGRALGWARRRYLAPG
jgi:uncharacterized protein YraI